MIVGYVYSHSRRSCGQLAKKFHGRRKSIELTAIGRRKREDKTGTSAFFVPNFYIIKVLRAENRAFWRTYIAFNASCFRIYWLTERLTNRPDYWLYTWSRVILAELTVPQLVRNAPILWDRISIAKFTRVCNWSISLASIIQAHLSIFFALILILTFYLQQYPRYLSHDQLFSSWIWLPQQYLLKNINHESHYAVVFSTPINCIDLAFSLEPLKFSLQPLMYKFWTFF
jgi:hypothetical protein